MKTNEAMNHLRPEEWNKMSVNTKIALLKAVRENLKKHAPALAQSDMKMKNDLMGEEIFTFGISKMSTAVPLGTCINACIELYESLENSIMPGAISTQALSNDVYALEVGTRNSRDKLLAGKAKSYLYVQGKPEQTKPTDKPAGIIAIMGAGNYSSSIEMVQAMFMDNKVVVHKPHKLNEATDAIWEKIFIPLIDVGALSFVEPEEGPTLTADPRLDKIYFTGGTKTAEIIMSNTDTPLIAECGGDNPCIIVPGDRAWTAKEMEHQAIQIASVAKMNGGAVCGRPQTVITSKNWVQRDEFIQALRKALEEQTPAAGTYYPGSDKVWEGFMEAYPDATVLHPQKGKYKAGKFMFLPNVAADSYAVTHEAFCQIINEVPLDTPANADAFLPVAVEFCNTKLLGTLGSCILVDEDTKLTHKKAVDTAVENMKYGAIAVNCMPPFIFMNPYLTWGGHEEREREVFTSGIGNFGNVLNYENVIKSVMVDDFMSQGHFLTTSIPLFDAMGEGMTTYVTDPSWGSFMKMMGGIILANFKDRGW